MVLERTSMEQRRGQGGSEEEIFVRLWISHLAGQYLLSGFRLSTPSAKQRCQCQAAYHCKTTLSVFQPSANSGEGNLKTSELRHAAYGGQVPSSGVGAGWRSRSCPAAMPPRITARCESSVGACYTSHQASPR